MSIQNLFVLNHQFNFNREYDKIESYLLELKSFYVKGVGYVSFNDLLQENFLKLPFVNTSRNLIEYFEERGVNTNPTSEEDIQNFALLKIEFYLNFIKLIPKFEKNLDTGLSREAFGKVISDLRYFIESLNYEIDHFDDPKTNYSYIILRKRDVDLESIVPSLTVDVEHSLKSFFDLRSRNNKTAKIAIIRDLYIYLDDNSKFLDINGQKDTYEKVKQSLNLFRHEKYKRFDDKTLMDLMDMTVVLLLHLVRGSNVTVLKSEISKIISDLPKKES